jgi:hypothetical protein
MVVINVQVPIPLTTVDWPDQPNVQGHWWHSICTSLVRPPSAHGRACLRRPRFATPIASHLLGKLLMYLQPNMADARDVLP